MVLARKYMIILTLVLLILPYLPYQAKAQLIEDISFFNHQMSVNEHGFILVNETIFIKNNFESKAILPFISINYPKELYEKIILQEISPLGFDLTKALTENHTIITIDPKGYEILPNNNITISVKFYLTRVFFRVNETDFSASIPLVPALNLPCKQVNSSLSLPYFIIFDSQHENFTKEVIKNKWTLSGSFLDVPKDFSITDNIMISNPANVYFALLEFTEAKRELILSSLGEIKVRDTITMINYDNASISKLKPDILTNDFKSVVIIPPLINSFPNPSSDANKKQVDLGTSLEKGEKYTITLEYPVKSSDFIKEKGSLFEFSVPLRSPIDGVVYNYVVKVTLPEGSFAYDKNEIIKINASPLDGNQNLEFRLGLAWASKDIMPIASFLFIAVLIAFVAVEKPFIKKELREINLRIKEYIESTEGKITAVRELIDLYKKRQLNQISKVEFKTVQKLLEERISKANAKINELKQKIVSLQPSLQKTLSDIDEINRNYDRNFRELINLYDQLYIKKIKTDIFDRLLPIHQRKVDDTIESLLNILETLQSELE